MLAPYPFARWPQIGRAEARRLRGLLRAAPQGDAAACMEVAEGLLGARPSCVPETPRVVIEADLARALAEPFVGLVFERDSLGDAGACVLALAPPLARTAVERALGGTDDATSGRNAVLDEISMGVVGYLGARMAQAYGGTLGLSAVTTDPAAVHAALGRGSALLVPMRVSLGRQAGQARLWIGGGAANVAASPNTPAMPSAAVVPRPALADALERIELVLSARVADAVLTRAALAALAPGDVVVPDRATLSRTAGGWHGSAELRIEGARRTRWRCRAEQATLTIEAIEIDEELSMTEGTTKLETPKLETPKLEATEPDALALAADAPVEIAVEIARFTLRLEDLSRLRTGEVLSTGRPIGEHVALRAGGRAIARGELVDVDGEVGVRVLEIAPPTRE